MRTKRTPHPVRAAYALARADIPCPSCDADPYDWCNLDGRVRQVPCLARMVKPDNPPGEAY
jgi:hypothetical protein